MTFNLEASDTEEGFIHLSVVIGEEDVWPHPNRHDPGSDFDPEDILSWVTDAWPSLHLEQSWPIRFERDQEPRSVTGLLRAAEERWDQFGEEDSDETECEATLIDAFLYSHDLAQMKHGAGLMPCFILRQHTRMRIELNGTIREDISFRAVTAALTGLGTQAAKLLRARGGEIAERLISRWENREHVDPIAAAAFLSGLGRWEIESSDDLSRAFREGLGNRGLTQIANDNNSPIQAAARSSGILGPAGLAEVLYHIKSLPNGDIRPIAELRRVIKGDLRHIQLPLDQGIRAAGRVREWLHLALDKPVDLPDISARLSIAVHRIVLSDDRLDGIATIGPQHGPAIILNPNTHRQGAGSEDLERSLRFTWAHEIGHLLLDHEEWAALIDATRQRVPRLVETRANAFATRLLLPTGVASRGWEGDGSPVDWVELERVLNRLTETFGVPRILAARQLCREIPPERRRLLEPVFRHQIENFDSR